MPKPTSRDDHELPDSAIEVDHESTDPRFPDEAQVKAFAEELLRGGKRTQGYEPVASERRHAQ